MLRTALEHTSLVSPPCPRPPKVFHFAWGKSYNAGRASHDLVPCHICLLCSTWVSLAVLPFLEPAAQAYARAILPAGNALPGDAHLTHALASFSTSLSVPLSVRFSLTSSSFFFIFHFLYWSIDDTQYYVGFTIWAQHRKPTIIYTRKCSPWESFCDHGVTTITWTIFPRPSRLL